MNKNEMTSAELSYMVRMLQVLPEMGSIEKIYRMLLALSTGGSRIGVERAMLFTVEPEEGVIRGYIGVEREDKRGEFHCIERQSGRFERHLPLPSDVDGEKISARFKKGVLQVKLPKQKEPQVQSKHIPIQTR